MGGWAESTVTFATQPSSTDFQSVNLAHNAIASKAFFSLNILDIANYWLNNISNNNGLLLQMNEDSNVYPAWLRISSGDNSNASQRPKLTIKYAYAKIDSSGVTTFCTGDSVTLTTNTGTYSYQWYKNNIAIAGATTTTYKAKTTGDYFVVITNATGCNVASAIKHVNVVASPSATITAQGPTTFCNGDSVKLQANTGTGFTYQWLKNNLNISSATASSYFAKTAGSYKVRVANSTGCSKSSQAISVSVPCREENIAETNDYTLYPNPFNKGFTISSADKKIIEYLKIIDANGRLIEQHENLDAEKIIGTELNKGIYIVEIFSNASIVYKRIVKL